MRSSVSVEEHSLTLARRTGMSSLAIQWSSLEWRRITVLNNLGQFRAESTLHESPLLHERQRSAFHCTSLVRPLIRRIRLDSFEVLDRRTRAMFAQTRIRFLRTDHAINNDNLQG